MDGIQWQQVQGKRVSPARAETTDPITTSPSRFQILENFNDTEETEEGEISQDQVTKTIDEQYDPSLPQRDGAEELNQRYLRTRSTKKAVGNIGKLKKGTEKKDTKKASGNGKNSKASVRKH